VICKNIPVWEGNQEIHMETYILHNSREFDYNRKRPAVLVLPGGAYMSTSDREAEPVALAFASKGYHAFVLRYSCKEKALLPQPILDAFKAILIIRDNAEEWCVDSNKIAVCGFSAGGHLASCLATMWNNDEFARALNSTPEHIRPDAVILSYPAIPMPNPITEVDTGMPESSLNAVLDKIEDENFRKAIFIRDGRVWMDLGGQMHRYLTGKDNWKEEDLKPYSTDLLVSDDTVPSFVWITADDALVPPLGVIRYVQAMLEHKRNVEFHLFASGPHGLSLATDITAGSPDMINREVAVWFDLAIAWLAKTLG